MYAKHILSAALLAAQASVINACSSGVPSIKDDNTVTLKLYSDANALVQTLSIGVLRTCHALNNGAHSLQMAVGQNLFGRNIHLNTFSSNNCTGGHQSISLTNSGVCVNGNTGTQNDWHSVQIAQS